MGVGKRTARQEADHQLELQVPHCVKWSAEQVAEWVSSIGYQRYAVCFTFNRINGRKLLMMDASHLPLIGITNFEDIKAIAAAVRKILEVEKPDYRRSISLPPRAPMGMYLQAKTVTGERIDAMNFATFLRKNPSIAEP